MFLKQQNEEVYLQNYGKTFKLTSWHQKQKLNRKLVQNYLTQLDKSGQEKGIEGKSQQHIDTE